FIVVVLLSAFSVPSSSVGRGDGGVVGSVRWERRSVEASERRFTLTRSQRSTLSRSHALRSRPNYLVASSFPLPTGGLIASSKPQACWLNSRLGAFPRMRRTVGSAKRPRP